jgi:hypothetical protein
VFNDTLKDIIFRRVEAYAFFISKQLANQEGISFDSPKDDILEGVVTLFSGELCDGRDAVLAVYVSFFVR